MGNLDSQKLDQRIEKLLSITEATVARREIDKEITEAKQVAETALTQIAQHERICELRYESINGKLGSIEEIKNSVDKLVHETGQSVNKLWGIANRAIGACYVASFLSVVLGLFYIIMKFASGEN